MTEYAWHFLRDKDGAPMLLDGRPLEVGRWYEHDGPLVLCQFGYHASTRAIDALSYAPGPWVSLCEVDGEILRDSDKLVATRRRAIWCYDGTEVLRQFARECAIGVLHLWDPPPPDVVVRYLQTGDESLRAAARAAAWAAACDAACDAAWASACDAALKKERLEQARELRKILENPFNPVKKTKKK